MVEKYKNSLGAGRMPDLFGMIEGRKLPRRKKKIGEASCLA
jgi:hypothetical protein